MALDLHHPLATNRASADDVHPVIEALGQFTAAIEPRLNNARQGRTANA